MEEDCKDYLPKVCAEVGSCTGDKTSIAQDVNRGHLKSVVHEERKSREKQTICYRVVEPKDSELLRQLAVLVTNAFLDGEPITAASKWTFEQLHQLPHAYVKARAGDGLLVAATTKDGELVGGMVQGDLVLGEHDLDHFGDAPEFAELFQLLGAAETQFTAYLEQCNLSGPGEVMYQFMIGVDKRFRRWQNAQGRSIAQEIVALSLELAKDKGYKLVMSEATNPGSQKVFQRAGYDVTSIVEPYKDYETLASIDFGDAAVDGVGNGLSVSYLKL